MNEVTTTTKKQFAEFEEWCQFYIRQFGLNHWEIHIGHEDLSGSKNEDATAYVCPSQRSHFACIRLNKKIYGKIAIGTLDLRRAALHEVLHIVLDPLYDIAWDRFSTEELLQQKNEEVCQHLTNIIYHMEEDNVHRNSVNRGIPKSCNSL